MQTNGPAYSSQIHDRRPQKWFWLDDALIDQHAAAIGPIGLALYTILARHANKQGQAYPSLARLCTLLGNASRNTVKKYLALLQHQGLLTWTVQQSASGDATSHLYTILPLSPVDLPLSPVDLPLSPVDLPLEGMLFKEEDPPSNPSIHKKASEAHGVLAYLNHIHGRSFENPSQIQILLAKGATVEDCHLVIDWLYHVERLTNPEGYQKYADNVTPFRPLNFDRHREKARRWREHNASAIPGQPQPFKVVL